MVRDISGLGSPPNTDTGTASRSSKAPSNSTTTPQASEPASKTVAHDDVEFSAEAKQLKSLADKVSGLPDVNESRVAEVRAALERNEFKIDNQQVADKILASDDLF